MGEMALVKETDGMRDIRDCHMAVGFYEFHGTFEPQSKQPGMRSHANSALEELEESKAIKTQESRDVVQHYPVRQVRLHEIPDAPELLLRQCSRNRQWRWLQKARKQDFKQIQNASLVQHRIGPRLPQARVHLK